MISNSAVLSSGPCPSHEMRLDDKDASSDAKTSTRKTFNENLSKVCTIESNINRAENPIGTDKLKHLKSVSPEEEERETFLSGSRNEEDLLNKNVKQLKELIRQELELELGRGQFSANQRSASSAWRCSPFTSLFVGMGFVGGIVAGAYGVSSIYNRRQSSASPDMAYPPDEPRAMPLVAPYSYHEPRVVSANSYREPRAMPRGIIDNAMPSHSTRRGQSIPDYYLTQTGYAVNKRLYRHVHFPDAPDTGACGEPSAPIPNKEMLFTIAPYLFPLDKDSGNIVDEPNPSRLKELAKMILEVQSHYGSEDGEILSPELASKVVRTWSINNFADVKSLGFNDIVVKMLITPTLNNGFGRLSTSSILNFDMLTASIDYRSPELELLPFVHQLYKYCAMEELPYLKYGDKYLNNISNNMQFMNFHTGFMVVDSLLGGKDIDSIGLNHEDFEKIGLIAFNRALRDGVAEQEIDFFLLPAIISDYSKYVEANKADDFLTSYRSPLYDIATVIGEYLKNNMSNPSLLDKDKRIIDNNISVLRSKLSHFEYFPRRLIRLGRPAADEILVEMLKNKELAEKARAISDKLNLPTPYAYNNTVLASVDRKVFVQMTKVGEIDGEHVYARYNEETGEIFGKKYYAQYIDKLAVMQPIDDLNEANSFIEDIRNIDANQDLLHSFPDESTTSQTTTVHRYFMRREANPGPDRDRPVLPKKTAKKTEPPPQSSEEVEAGTSGYRGAGALLDEAAGGGGVICNQRS